MIIARIELLFNKFMEGSCSQQEFSELMDLLRKNEQDEHARRVLYEVYQHSARVRRSVTYVDEYGELQTGEVAETIPARVVARKTQTSYPRLALILVLAALVMAAAIVFF